MRSCIPKLLLVALTVASFSLRAEPATVSGYWREPKGSVLRIARCEDKLCVEIVALSPTDRAEVDLHNPDPALRGRPLCGLRIGGGFMESDSEHADGGHLYDPRSGRTYRGSMTVEGDQLKLRGFVGIKLFGRTETWERTRPLANHCQRQK
jgi:uncharacterized protein (DUF2147 family)